MRLYFIQEAVYLELDGQLYSNRIQYDSYWERFLDHFTSVTIMARVKNVKTIPQNYHISTGPKIDYIPLNYYNGPYGYFRNVRSIKKIIKSSINKNSVYILRIPGILGSLMARELNKRKIKYAVEVVGDPFEVARFLNLPFPIKTLYKYLAYFQMKKITKGAIGALYVTESTLQKRYPVKEGCIIGSASNVIIQENQIADISARINNSKLIPKRARKFELQLVKIGVVGMLYSVKSPLEIVKTIKLLISNGMNAEVHFAGDGPLFQKIIDLAVQLDIEKKVVCHGSIASGGEIIRFLDSMDLYVQFSKTEGMPRAMIEAMSRGCPVIASNVGGIPELLPKDLLVRPGDIVDLEKIITYLLSNNERIQKAITENISLAEKFTSDKLRDKRYEFYSELFASFQN